MQIKWMAAAPFDKAANQGHAEAQDSLGVICKSGEGVELNLELDYFVFAFEVAMIQELAGATHHPPDT